MTTTPLLITNPPSPSPSSSSSSSVNNSSPTHPSPPTNVVLGSSSSSVSIGGGGGGSNNGTPRSSMTFMGQVAISRVRMVQNVIKDLITEITFCDNKPNSEYKQFYDSIEDYLMNQNTCDVVYVELLNRCLQQEMLIVSSSVSSSSSSSINSNNNNNNNISLLANDTTTSTNNNATSASSTSITTTTTTTTTTNQQQQQHASSYYSHVIIMSKCMELMKQFLKNYRPSVSVLIQIHSFCHQCIMMNNNNNNNNKTAATSVSLEQQITLPVLLNKTLVFIKNYIERVMSSSVSSVSSSSSHNNHSLTEWNMYIRDYSSSNNNNNNNNNNSTTTTTTTTTTSASATSDAVNDVLTATTPTTAVPSSSSSSAIANSGTNQYYSQFDSSSPQSLNHHLHNRFSMESSSSPSSSSTTDQQNHLMYMTMLSMMMSNDLVQYKYQSSSSSTSSTSSSTSTSTSDSSQQQPSHHHNNKNHLLENNVYMGAQFKTHSKFEDKSPEIDTTNMLQINHLSSLQKQIDTVIQYKKQKKDGNQQQQQQQQPQLSSPRQTQQQQQQQLHSPQSTPSKKKNHSKSSSTGFMSHNNNNNNNHSMMDGGGIDVAHVSTSSTASGATTTTTAEASSASSSSFYYRILSHLFLIPYNNNNNHNNNVKMNHAQQQQHVTDQTSLNELLDMMLLTNDYYQSSTTTSHNNNNNNNNSHESSDGDSSNSSSSSSSHMIDYEIMIQSSIRLIKDHFSSLYTTTTTHSNNNSSHSRQQLTSFFLEMIESPHAHVRVHSFDFLFNLLHYSIERVDDSGTIQSMISSLYKSQHQNHHKNNNSNSSSNVNGSAAISTVMNHMNVMMIVVDLFQKYCDMVLFLLLNHERDALVWNSAYHCLFSFITIINHCVHQQQLYNNHQNQNHNYRSSSSSSSTRSRSSSTNNRYHSGSHHHNNSNNNQTMMMLTMMIPMSMVQMLDVRVIHHFVQLYHMSNRDCHTHINHNNNNNNNNNNNHHHHHHHMKYHMKVKYYNNCSNDSLSLLVQWMTNSIMSIHHLNHFYLQGKRMSNTVGDLPVIDPMNNASNGSSGSSGGSSSSTSHNNQSSTNTSISYHLDDTKLQMIGGISSIIDMYIQYHNIHVRNNLFVILYEYCWYQLWVNNNNNNNSSQQQQQQQQQSSSSNNSNNNNDYHYSYYYHLLFELFAKVSAPYHMQQMFIYLPLDMIQSLSKSLFMCYLNEYHQNNNNNTSNNNSNSNNSSNNNSNSPLTLNNNNYFYHNSSVRESIQQNIISFCIQMYQIAKSYCAMESECSQIANELISTGLAMNNNNKNSNSRSSGDDDDESDDSLSSNYHTCIHLLSSLLKSKDSMEQRSGQYLFFSVLKWVDEASANNNNNNNSSAANMLHSPHKNNQYWMPPTTSSSQRLINQSNASYFEKLKQSLDALMNDLSLSQDEHDQLAYLSALSRLIHFQKSKFQSHGDPDRLKLLFTMMNNSLLRLTSHTNMSAIVLLDMFSIIMSFVHMYPISLTNPSGSTTTAGNGKNNLQDSTRSHGPYDNMIHGGLCSNEDHYHHANNSMIGSECDDGTNHCMYNHNDDHDDDSLTTTNNKKRTNHAHRSVNECDMDMYSLFLSGKSCVSFRLLKEVSISILHFIFTSLSAIVSSPSSRTSSSIRGTDVEQVERVRIICILFIIEKCSRNRQVLDSIGIHFFKQLLEDCNGAVAFFAAKFLMKLLANKFPEEYLKFMKQLIPRAQKSGNAHLLHNPFLQLMVED